MSKCKACGAEIIWIKTPNGKPMPCDAQKIPYKLDIHNGDLVLVRPDGRIARGTLDLESDEYGYESHFANCPAASSFRRRNK